MPLAVRVRLYRGNELTAEALEADTDEESDAPGSETADDMAGVQALLVELCQAFHGPEAHLLGFSRMWLDYQLPSLKNASLPLTYRHGYYALIEGKSPRATEWKAQVDIVVSP
jgi:hypothetical protein